MELEKALISNPFYYSRKQIVKIKGIIEPTTRIKHSKLIGKIGSLLGLPYYSICTGLYLYHRLSVSNPYILEFYASKIELVWIACLSLAMKMEETVRRLQDIYLTTMSILAGSGADTGATLGSGEVDPKEMKEVKDIVMDVERLLLEDVQFDVEIHSPHRFCLSFLKLLKLKGTEKAGWIDEFARDCWNTINTSYLCPLSILYPPHVIAVACILCCLKLSQLEIPSNLVEEQFYKTVSCGLSDAVGAGKEIMDLAILMAIRDEEKVVFGKVSRELDALVENDEARRKLLERKPDAPNRVKYDTPRPQSASGGFRDYNRQQRDRSGLDVIARNVRNARIAASAPYNSAERRGRDRDDRRDSRYYDDRRDSRDSRDSRDRSSSNRYR